MSSCVWDVSSINLNGEELTVPGHDLPLRLWWRNLCVLDHVMICRLAGLWASLQETGEGQAVTTTQTISLLCLQRVCRWRQSPRKSPSWLKVQLPVFPRWQAGLWPPLCSPESQCNHVQFIMAVSTQGRVLGCWLGVCLFSGGAWEQHDRDSSAQVSSLQDMDESSVTYVVTAACQ